MELHPKGRVGAVLHGHDFAGVTVGRRDQFFGQFIRDVERVVAAG